MILRFIKLDRSGVYRRFGAESMTRLAPTLATARALEPDADLMRVGPPVPASISSLIDIPIPRATSLDSSYTAGQRVYRPLDVVESLTRLRQQMETGRI